MGSRISTHLKREREKEREEEREKEREKRRNLNQPTDIFLLQMLLLLFFSKVSQWLVYERSLNSFLLDNMRFIILPHGFGSTYLELSYEYCPTLE